MRNVFDTNIWLGAWDENYARNVFPDVWGKLSAAVRNGLIVSPPAVNDEVLYPDDLREWISEHRKWLESPMVETPNFPQTVADEVGDLRNKYPKLAGGAKRRGLSGGCLGENSEYSRCDRRKPGGEGVQATKGS